MRQLIVGIDPGTTLGYAVLDIDGNILKLGSSKQLNLSSLITEVIKYGKPLIVGCDKHFIPEFVNKFATKLGSRIIRPEEDLHVFDKKEIVHNYLSDARQQIKEQINQQILPANLHEGDALASAISAFKKMKPLLIKINNFVLENKKEPYKQKLTEIVLLNETINIKDALELAEKSERKSLDNKASGLRYEDKLALELAEKKKHLSEQDYLRLYHKVKSQEKDISLLRNQNSRIQTMLGAIRKLPVRKIKVVDKDAAQKIEFKEKRIQHYGQLLRMKNEQIDAMKNEISLLNMFLLSLKENVLLKKLNTLSYNEYAVKNALLNITAGDVLLVNDLSMFSNQTIKELDEKVGVIIHKRPITQKVRQHMPFILLQADKFNLQESKDFATVSKEQLMRAKNSSNILSEIVQQYKNERMAELK